MWFAGSVAGLAALELAEYSSVVGLNVIPVEVGVIVRDPVVPAVIVNVPVVFPDVIVKDDGVNVSPDPVDARLTVVPPDGPPR